MVSSLYFMNFGRGKSGKVITSHGNDTVVFASNPYGGHNLVMVDENLVSPKTPVAYIHGTGAVLRAMAKSFPRKKFVKTLLFLNREWFREKRYIYTAESHYLIDADGIMHIGDWVKKYAGATRGIFLFSGDKVKMKTYSIGDGVTVRWKRVFPSAYSIDSARDINIGADMSSLEWDQSEFDEMQ